MQRSGAIQTLTRVNAFDAGWLSHCHSNNAAFQVQALPEQPPLHHKADLDGNNLTLLCLGNRVSAWGKPYPQSCFGSLPKIGLNVEARCLSFYFVETPDLNGFMHAKYFL